MEFANFHREGDKLRIWGNLNWPLDVKFDIETSALLAEAAQKGLTDVTIDVRDVESMGSQYLGALAAVAADMKKRGGALTVLARGKIAKLITDVGLHRVLMLDTE
jgi:anti-anti-sigma factor